MATPRTPRSGGSEPAQSEASTEVTSSIKAWFSSTFSAFTGFRRSATTTETNEPSANDDSTTSKQPGSERTEQRKSQQSKAEQQAKASPSEPEKKRSDTARAPSTPLQVQILEAAGDKFVPGAAELSEDEKRTAIEAVGEKDVFALQTVEEAWQKELYEQFLEWRITQLMFRASDEKISSSRASSD